MAGADAGDQTSGAGSVAVGPSSDPDRTPSEPDSVITVLETRNDKRTRGVESRLTRILTPSFRDVAAAQRDQGEQIGQLTSALQIEKAERRDEMATDRPRERDQTGRAVDAQTRVLCHMREAEEVGSALRWQG